MKKIRYSGNKFDQKQLYSAIKCITQNWWVFGQKGLEFQKKFCNLVNRKYGVFVNSGSSANLLAMYYAKKLGYKKVITPVCGFPTTINPIIQFGLEPIFIDIDKGTLNLNIDQLETAAKENPKSVLFFAHALGNPPEMDRVMQIVEKYQLYLMQDCCDALGSSYGGMKLGTFGNISTYSFYPAHHMTTGEGGFLTTNDYNTYKSLVSFRDWGRDCTCRGKQDALKQNGRCNKRYGNWLPGLPDLEWDHKYTYSQIGFNLKPLQLQAVIGIQQIKKLPQFEFIRYRNYHILREELKINDYMTIPISPDKSTVCWFCFPISLKEDVKVKRSEVINYLEQNGIQTRLYFGGNILYQQAYKDIVNTYWNGDYCKVKERFPNADFVTKHTFFIGISPLISQQDIRYMASILNNMMVDMNVK